MAEQLIELQMPYFDPEPNVPEPVVVQSEHKCFLVFSDRKYNRTSLEFLRCRISKFGYPNDESLGGHQLYGKGLSIIGFFEVIESEWIAQLKEANKVNFPHTESFKEARHFVVTFRDSTFECIASEFGPVDRFPQVDSGIL